MQKNHIIKLNNRVFRPTDTLNLLLSSLTNQKLKKKFISFEKKFGLYVWNTKIIYARD